MQCLYRFSFSDWYGCALYAVMACFVGIFTLILFISQHEYQLILFPWPLLCLFGLYLASRGVYVPYRISLTAEGQLLCESLFYTRLVGPATVEEIRVSPYIPHVRMARFAVFKYPGGQITVLPDVEGFGAVTEQIDEVNASVKWRTVFWP